MVEMWVEWWRRRRWWCVPLLLVISGQTCTSASLSGSKGSSGSKSPSMQLQAAIYSLTERNLSTDERERDSRDEDTTDASIYEEMNNSQDAVKKSGKIEKDEVKTKMHGKEKITSYVNPSENVLTLEEVKRKMKKKEISVEGFRPEAVENELQRLLTYFDPAQQDGRSGQSTSMSLWEYLVNYVTGDVQPQLLPQSYNREKPTAAHPCDNVPGDYNQWFRDAVSRRVVVVGGGVAGLAALTTLIKLKVDDALLLEATDRMGGRVKTIRYGDWVAEEGPGLIQGGQENPLYQIAKEEGVLGGAVDDTLKGVVFFGTEENVVTSRGEPVSRAITELHVGIQQHLQHDLSSGELEDYYDKSLGEFLSSRHQRLWGPVGELSLKAASQHIIHQAVNTQFGSCTWFNVSTRDADNFVELGQDHSWWGGMEGLVHTLMNQVPQGQVRMLSPVCKVFWDLPEGSRALVVAADGSSYLADHLLMMLPLGVLRERHNHTFVPPLPNSFSRAISVVEPGTVNQLNLGWASPWWGSGAFHMVVFWKSNDFPPEMDWVSNIVQVRSTDCCPALLEMKVTGEASLIMEKLDPETIISHLITFLRATNKNSVVPLPLFFHRSKCNENMWARGSYQSYVTAGEGALLLQDRSPLATKLYNSRRIQPVFFGGEHTSTDRFGTVDGAFLSGVRAALWATGQLQQERSKNNGSYSTCSKDMMLAHFDLFKHPEKYYQRMMSCDNLDRKKFSKERKRKRKNGKRKKKNKDSQYAPEDLLQKTKSATSHKAQKNLAIKTVNDSDRNKDKFIKTPVNKETHKMRVLHTDAEEKKTTNVPNDKQMKEVREKNNNTEDEKKEPSLLVPYEAIIEAFIEKLSEPTEGSNGFEENHTSEGKGQRKNIMKKKKKLKNTRKMHKNKSAKIKRKNTRLSSSTPLLDQTMKISVPQQSLNIEENRGTHLHFYLSHPKKLLNLTNTSDQKDVKTKSKTKAPPKPDETGDQESVVTYHSFLSQHDQHLPSASPSEVADHLPPAANWSDGQKMAGIRGIFSGHHVSSGNSETFFSSNYTFFQHPQDNSDYLSNITHSATTHSGTLTQPALPPQKSSSQDGTLNTSSHANSKEHSIKQKKNSTFLHEVNDRRRKKKHRSQGKRRNKGRRRGLKKQQRVEHSLQEMIYKEIRHNFQDVDKENTFSNHNQMTSRTEVPEHNGGQAPTKNYLSFLPYYKRFNVTTMLQPVTHLQPKINTYSTLLISPDHEIPRVDMDVSNKQNYSKVSQ